MKPKAETELDAKFVTPEVNKVLQYLPGKLLPRLTFLRTVFNALPISRPFLTPFKGQVAALADLGWEAVL
jgi:hypothetical protein